MSIPNTQKNTEKNWKKLEKKFLYRKLYRLAALFFPLFYILYNKEKTVILLASIFFIYIIIEVLRLGSFSFNHFLFTHLNRFLKEKEKNRISTSTLFLFSSLMTVLFFEKTIAIYAIVFAIVGDACANIIGLKYGSIRFKQKSLEGFLAFFISAIVSGYLLKLCAISINSILIIIGSLAAALIELLSSRIDDNLTVPVGGAFFMMLVNKISSFT